MEGAVPFCDGYYRCVHPDCAVRAFGRGGRGFLRARDCARHCLKSREHLFPSVRSVQQHPMHFIMPDVTEVETPCAQIHGTQEAPRRSFVQNALQ